MLMPSQDWRALGNSIFVQPKVSKPERYRALKLSRNCPDFYSVTAAHYINGGETALAHFCFLFNTMLENIELTAVPEMNTAHAIVLHKGHGKDKALELFLPVPS